MQAGRTDVAIWVRAWPLELVNGAPLDAPVTLEHANELREQVAPNLFRHFDLSRFPGSTLDALSLANRAYQNRPRGRRASQLRAPRRPLRVRPGHFGPDPRSRLLARDLGVVMPDESDYAGVMADWHEGQRRGVLGSPHFFCGDDDVFCPSLDITKGSGQGRIDRQRRLAPDGVPGRAVWPNPDRHKPWYDRADRCRARCREREERCMSGELTSKT